MFSLAYHFSPFVSSKTKKRITCKSVSQKNTLTCYFSSDNYIYIYIYMYSVILTLSYCFIIILSLFLPFHFSFFVFLNMNIFCFIKSILLILLNRVHSINFSLYFFKIYIFLYFIQKSFLFPNFPSLTFSYRLLNFISLLSL